MRRFYFTIGIFVLVNAAILLIPISGESRLVLLVAAQLALLAVLVYGASMICSRFFVHATCKGDPESNRVAITFDDGPYPVRSKEIGEILGRFNCKASFFLTGKNLNGNEQIVRELAAAGHTIGNHSFSHSNFFPLFPGRKISGEVGETNTLLEEITGKEIRYFRPPFGVTNPNVARGLKGTGMHVIGWSIRSFDTRNGEAGKVIRRITRRMGGGDIILLHETSDNILQILEQLLPVIREKGLHCVNLDQLFDGVPD